MITELILAVFLMAVGLSVAGAGTHFYQSMFHEPAILRFDGAHFTGMIGHLLMSFFCGPYIMLRLGWGQGSSDGKSLTNVLVGSAVSFGWAFITGLLFIGIYMAVLGR